jgi:hypothetical protein
VAPSKLKQKRFGPGLTFERISYHTAAVLVEYRYRGRRISDREIAFLRQFIAEHPELSRCALSRRICEAWQWKQANGALREMVCRGLMLALERAGHIELPPVLFRVRNHLVACR